MNNDFPQNTTLPSTEEQTFTSKPNAREWVILSIILLTGAALRLWKIDQNGTGNPYYAAAVRSMLLNWHNFFFVSFDPAGFVTVDKPPVALWIQTAFAKVLGYRGFSLILPQILEGLGAILIVYHLVRRRFGFLAAVFSALVLSLSPVSVAVDRYNNTDACLVFVLLLSAWALILAAEKGSRNLLFLSFVLVGIGFNTKMMAAFVVLPVFYLVYLTGTPLSWFQRLRDLALATILLLAVALSWPLAVDWTAPEHRPFVGSTQDNSMVSLSLGWNGFQRLLSRDRPGMPPNARTWNRQHAAPDANTTPALGERSATSSDSSSTSSVSDPVSSPAGPAPQRPSRPRRAGGMDTGTPGLFRLADKNMAGQAAWFLPLALLGVWMEIRRTRFRFPLDPPPQAILLWLGWFLLYAVVFSFMRGAMHAYYLVLLVPPLAALAGIGIKALWMDLKEGRKAIPLWGLFLAASWQAFIAAQYPDWKNDLLILLLTGIGLSLIGLFALPVLTHKKITSHSYASCFLGLGLCVLFFCPMLWALTPVLGSGQRVEASPELLTNPQGRGMAQGPEAPFRNAKLLSFLKKHRHGEPILVVAQNSQAVAPIIIETGEPAVALGGFMGGDPILTLNQFEQRVKDGEFRYMLLPNFQERQTFGSNGFPGLGGPAGGRGNAFGMGRMGGSQAEIAKWVRENGAPVDPSLWKPAVPPVEPSNPATSPLNGFNQGFPGAFGGRRGGAANFQLYDLRPDLENQEDPPSGGRH